jgi:hypothetical protein
VAKKELNLLQFTAGGAAECMRLLGRQPVAEPDAKFRRIKGRNLTLRICTSTRGLADTIFSAIAMANSR